MPAINHHKGAPDYWFGRDSAPNFSRKVAQASEDVRAAEKRLLEALQHAYPMSHRVQVFHYRGNFFGNVIGWDTHGIRVFVKNARSGKSNGWWAAQVQLADE